jgi:hypothetical protein
MNKFWYKFWCPTEQRILNKSGNIYFAGATLCIDHENRHGGIAINQNGTGFVYGTLSRLSYKKENGKIYVPDDIMILAKQLYYETKGRHYVE